MPLDTFTLTRRQRRRSPTTGERFPPGTLLAGRYRITHALGQGGMGEVYRADDQRLGVPVALKFLPDGWTQDEDQLSLLLNEARLARTITHENVCRIHDVGESCGLHFISMELIVGEDLASLLRRIGRLPQDKAIDIARGICAGLEAAHGQGILHRDLKPANVMIDEGGEVRITDFGLSHHVAGASKPIATSAPDALAGTPAYMAPEQTSGGEVSVRTDLYALGLVLYEVFTGHRVFVASSTEELTRLHREAAPPPPSSLVRELDPAIEKLILRCLEKAPGARPASAQAVASALPGRSELAAGTVLKTLLVSELVSLEATEALDAVDLDEATVIEIAERHMQLKQELLREHAGRAAGQREDGLCQMLFQRPIHAVLFARAYHEALSQWRLPIRARVGIHLGEVILRREVSSGTAASPDSSNTEALTVEGPSKPMAARLTALASGGQTLMNRAAFDVARRSAVDDPVAARRLSWLAHGRYVFADAEEPIEIFEVGDRNLAPLRAPDDSAASRVLGEDVVLGWRPAPGLALPSRERWAIDRKLGEGSFGEVWLAVHKKTRERRVFKFCYEVSRLRGLQREITLFRLLKEELGERDDIARILDWNFEQAPYFVESEYTAGGDLVEWAEARGGIGEVPFAQRLEIVAQVADALAAAHSVGVLHKDVKPANVLVWRDAEGHPRTRLTDFGIGSVTDPTRLAAAGITLLGWSDTNRSDGSNPGGTRLYMAPELLEGKAATVQADVYALGVMLYQVLTGDLGRALAPGWRREIDDELLREDVAAAVDGDAGRRLANAADLARRLRRLDGRHAERRAAEQLRDTVEQATRRRHQASAAAAVLAVLAMVGLALWLTVRKERNRARDLARVAVAERLLAEHQTTLGNLVALEVRHPDCTAVATLRKALRQPVYLANLAEGRDAELLPDSWSPSPSRLLAVERQARPALCIWDGRTFEELRCLRGHTDEIRTASWNGDGSRILSASTDGTARIWDAGSGEELLRIESATGPVHLASWNGDGSRVLTISRNTATIWEATTGEEIVSLRGHTDRILAASWSADNRRVLTASADGTARVWDAITGEPTVSFVGHTEKVDVASWSRDGRRVLTVSADLTARIWDAITGKENARLTGHQNGIHSASWNRDGTRVLTASWETARIWDADTGEHLASLLGHTDWCYWAAWSHDGRRVLTGSSDRTARIWDARTSEEVARMDGHADTVSAATWSAADGLVLAVSWDTARIWNPRTGEEALRMDGHIGAVRSVAWSAAGTQVLTASDDRTARVWDTTTGQQVLRLEGHRDVVSSAVWSADGYRILTASDDHTARIWDGRNGEEILRLEGHTDILSSAEWSAAGSHVLTASLDGTARIWDAATGEEVVHMEGDADTPWSAAWSSGDTQVLTTSADGVVRTWDARSGEEVVGPEGARVPDPRRPVAEDIGQQIGRPDLVDAAWSADGRRVVTGGADGTVRVWVMDDADASYLRGRVRARTRICLDAGFRQATLGESAQQARRDTAACEACVPVFFERLGAEPAPWENYAAAWRAYASCLGRSGS